MCLALGHTAVYLTSVFGMGGQGQQYNGLTRHLFQQKVLIQPTFPRFKISMSHVGFTCMMKKLFLSALLLAGAGFLAPFLEQSPRYLAP